MSFAAVTAGNAPAPLLKPGKNCWRVENATYASVVVDCGNYYRDLHEAICKAKHSLFILGWDIDSRIELLRGDDSKHKECPTNLFELLQWKARQNPEMTIYLNRWDYSIFLLAEREAFGEFKWRYHSPPNIHYCLDSILPPGACHHQKIITVDDEIAFSGGMDIALERWDMREHHPKNPHRKDPGGPVEASGTIKYHPFHDIQCVVAGPAARALAELARERWRLGAGFEPVPLREIKYEGLPEVWPDSDPPDFENVPVGISLTVPPMYGKPAVRQIEQLYLDQIARAEKFIYMENQFFTERKVAFALNKRLREKPELRVLLVSCYEPKGIMEKKSMWTNRVYFRDIVESGGVADRVVLTHPLSRENGVERPVRIHSKITIIDDKWLRVASSNINNRSMGVDTECDLLFEGNDEKSQGKIAAIRNDLIREHTGREEKDIQKLVDGNDGVEKFLTYITTSRQHLRKIDDEIYRKERFTGFATRIADPSKPFLPGEWTMPYRDPEIKRSLPKRLIFTFLLIVLLCALAMVWKMTPLAEYTSAEKITPFLEKLRAMPLAAPATIGIFVLGGIFFFPLLVLIAATAATFGPLKGFLIAATGALLSASVGFVIGRLIGTRWSRLLLGSSAEKLKQYAEKAGVAGMAILRMVPVAPFSAVNIGLGLSNMSFVTYITGTALGLLPGILAFAFLGDSMMQLWRNPDRQTVLYFAMGVAGWLAVLAASHFAVRYRRKQGAAA